MIGSLFEARVSLQQLGSIFRKYEKENIFRKNSECREMARKKNKCRKMIMKISFQQLGSIFQKLKMEKSAECEQLPGKKLQKKYRNTKF